MNNNPHFYEATIDVAATPAVCYDAIAGGMSEWWTETTEGELEKVGDKLKVIFPPDFGYWTFQATKMEPGKVIEMVCIDAHHHVSGQPEEIDREWLGTKIVWTFSRIDSKTQVSIAHEGLTPQLHCWDICLDGWNHFFKGSLRRYLDGETASPHRVE